MLMKFTKMHGLGNDFVVIDAVTQNVRVTGSMVRRLANRTLGIGCDQVLVIEPPTEADIDFNYRIFNQDGGEVEQCGNGARCLARYVYDRQLTGKNPILVKAKNRVMTMHLEANKLVTVDMGIPQLDPAQIPFKLSSKLLFMTLTQLVKHIKWQQSPWATPIPCCRSAMWILHQWKLWGQY